VSKKKSIGIDYRLNFHYNIPVIKNKGLPQEKVVE
jgi:hypothetical protein